MLLAVGRRDVHELLHLGKQRRFQAFLEEGAHDILGYGARIEESEEHKMALTRALLLEDVLLGHPDRLHELVGVVCVLSEFFAPRLLRWRGLLGMHEDQPTRGRVPVGRTHERLHLAALHEFLLDNVRI